MRPSAYRYRLPAISYVGDWVRVYEHSPCDQPDDLARWLKTGLILDLRYPNGQLVTVRAKR